MGLGSICVEYLLLVFILLSSKDVLLLVCFEIVDGTLNEDVFFATFKSH